MTRYGYGFIKRSQELGFDVGETIDENEVSQLAERKRKYKKLKKVLSSILRDSVVGAGAGALLGGGVDIGRTVNTPFGPKINGRVYPNGRIPLSEYKTMKALALTGALGGALHGAVPPYK